MQMANVSDYTTFQCVECKYKKTYPTNTADGRKCEHCGSRLFIKAKEYILFKCMDCGTYQAVASWKPDGHICTQCNGFIKAIGKYTKGDISDMLQSGEMGKQEEIFYLG